MKSDGCLISLYQGHAKPVEACLPSKGIPMMGLNIYPSEQHTPKLFLTAIL